MNSPEILKRQKEVFLEALAKSGNVTSAARAAGWKYPTIAEGYRQTDNDFAFAWRDAQTQANDALLSEARRRAVEGVDKPVFYKGDLVGSIREYSDSLLNVLLKAEMPERFREGNSSQAEESGVLVVPRTPASVSHNDWEANVAKQQTELLARSE